MPRFYFNVYDGFSIHDRDGMVLADFHEARREALLLASGMLDQATQGRLGEDWRLEVTDGAGVVLFHLDFKNRIR